VLAAVAERHDVAGVVTQPDRPAGRGQRLVATPVKQAAQARGLRVLTPERLRSFVDEARDIGAEAFVVASYGKIVPRALLELVPVAFNVHPSLLPLYRGATPLQSAIRDGRTQTAVTIIAMDAGMDTGDVLLQEPLPIGATETYGELHDRTAAIGAAMVIEAIDRYRQGTLAPRTQVELAREFGITEAEIGATLTRPLHKDDLVIQGDLSMKQIVDLIRSLSPNPAARTKGGFAGFGPGKILAASVARDAPAIPAKIRDPGAAVLAKGRIWLEAVDGMVQVDALQMPGGKPMTARQFALGHPGLSGPQTRLPYVREFEAAHA